MERLSDIFDSMSNEELKTLIENLRKSSEKRDGTDIQKV